jgi:hypothetical protein
MGISMPEKIVFILSTSRTGTKTLADELAGDGILSPHQPPYSRLLTVASNYYLHGWLPRRTLEWLVRRLREPQIMNADCRYYIQVYSLDYLPAKIISQKHPNVYVIHIVRDPRTFVRSYLNWIHSRVKSFVANKFVLGWHPSGFFTGEMHWQDWRQMDDFQRVCWHWAYKNALLKRLFEGGERYTQVKFEDLFLGPGLETLRAMLSFVGIPYQNRFATIIEQARNPSHKSFFPPWQDWEPELCARLDTLCGQTMARYGYGQETEWQEKVQIGKMQKIGSTAMGEHSL